MTLTYCLVANNTTKLRHQKPPSTTIFRRQQQQQQQQPNKTQPICTQKQSRTTKQQQQKPHFRTTTSNKQTNSNAKRNCQQQMASSSVSKQHLSSRVKSITGKLFESHGSELRRTLFSLRQIFQDDQDLATEFIDSAGLECLLKVAADADQIHQNYILRAIGQLIAYPSGMNGLTRHNETIQWLYTLLASQHRLVVKTSIKLLLLFVNHSDNNCLHFCRAVKFVDDGKGLTTWTSLVNLLKNNSNVSKESSVLQLQQQQHDVGLLIDAMTLINKTLAGIPDQDTYYDFVEPLEDLGIETIIKNNSHLDPQLREQFELYDQVLRTEDEDNLSIDNDEQVESSVNEDIAPLDSRAFMENKMVTREDSSPDSARRRSKRVWPQQASSKAYDTSSILTSGDDLQGGDDNYESANESNGNESHKLLQQQQQLSHNKQPSVDQGSPKQPQNDVQQQDHRHRSSSALAEQQVATRSNSIKQPNLSRSKQQRASISSCSSSDSYASYGSGYASGSGNSTDLEHKQKRNLISGAAANTASSNSSNKKRDKTTLAACQAAKNCESGASSGLNREDDETDTQEVDEDDSQLRQHLSELEQLTDELANRNIFGTLNQPVQTTSKHFSSTIKSISSNASSILSTGSISSGLSATNDSLPHLKYQDPHQKAKAALETTATGASNDDNTDSINADSRSNSATPTSKVQATSTLSTSSESYTQPYLSSRQQTNGSVSETVHQAHITRQSHQYAKPSSCNTSTTSPTQQQQQQQQSSNNAAFTNTTTTSAATANGNNSINTSSNAVNTTSTSSASAKQEPYYHNLFQWEQLVSKGVTRPLLINDLDFTDLRDEDDCDLLNSSNNNASTARVARNQSTGEPLLISIPGTQRLIQGELATNTNDEDSAIESGAGTGSPKSNGAAASSNTNVPGTPASAPPPMPPPISPWFNTISGSRPQSQFMSSPSPPYEQSSSGDFNRDQSPANSTYSNYSRNSVCVPQASTPTRDSLGHHLHQQYNTLQPVTNLRSASSMSSLLFGNNGKYANKRKKTMKLFWKEVREDRSLLSKLTKKRTIWDEIKPVPIDTQKLEHLFESKAKDLLLSKSRNGLDGLNQRKVKITVLDAKRSNAINIGMTKLPPMRTIKSAVLKMDSSIMNREGIEKILTTMMPTEEEKSRIIEAQLANPDTPLGTAEQFLLNLASISALEARLKLWAFQLDYSQIEKEVAEPLMDLKQAIEEIERSETFRVILGTLLAIGNFLNSTNVKGFQIDYLEKVPEVKDTVHKHSLLHHLCLFIQEKYDSQLASDLYSEFSAVNRASKVDYTEVAKNLKKMQQDCKSSWDYLKIVAKHDGLANLMNACGSSSSSSSGDSSLNTNNLQHSQPKSSGKLNNLSKLSMITTVMSSESNSSAANGTSSSSNNCDVPTTKQLKTKVSDFLTDCAERIMVLMVIHRRVMNRFQKLLVYLGCPSHQIKQTQPQQILKIINEFALEYRTKRERVREMLMKKQQCQHHHHHQGNRWQLSGSNRSHWAGSHQCIDSIGSTGNGSFNHNHPLHLQRPCSTTSCASSYATNPACADSMCNLSSTSHQSNDSGHQVNHHQQHTPRSNRANSPSGYSQISNYSDYLFDQSPCCNSRQQSVGLLQSSEKTTFNSNGSNHLNRRPHSMSVSMYDLQNQQNSANNSSLKEMTDIEGVVGGGANQEEREQRQKDEQLRQLLGAGKSFDDTCNDLYSLSHWSSTMTRVTRHPPISQGHAKQRAFSMDSPGKDEELNTSGRRQSSYYKYLHNTSGVGDDVEQNSDEEILQSLVRTTTSNHSGGGGGGGSGGKQNGSHSNRSPASSHNSSASNKSARSKILSRFNYDRKSFRRTLRNGIEVSNMS